MQNRFSTSAKAIILVSSHRSAGEVFQPPTIWWSQLLIVSRDRHLDIADGLARPGIVASHQTTADWLMRSEAFATWRMITPS